MTKGRPEQPKPGGGPPPEVAPREDVRLLRSPHRCPYCHEGVAVDDPHQVACRACLGRHHQACWEEAGRCAACRGQVALGPEAAGPSRAGRRPGLAGLGGLLLAAGLGLGALTLALWTGDRGTGDAGTGAGRAPPAAGAFGPLDLSGSDEEVTDRLRARAAAGDPAAMNLLGFRLMQGLGCERDDAEAYRWGRAAAEAGHAEAMYGVALLLEQGGEGVPRDEAAAAAWYRRAVAAGDTLAGPALERLLARRPDLR